MFSTNREEYLKKVKWYKYYLREENNIYNYREKYKNLVKNYFLGHIEQHYVRVGNKWYRPFSINYGLANMSWIDRSFKDYYEFNNEKDKKGEKYLKIQKYRIRFIYRYDKALIISKYVYVGNDKNFDFNNKLKIKGV